MCFADLCFSCYSHYNPVETVGPRGVGRDRGWGGGIIIRHHTKYSDAHISDFYGGQKVIMWETRCFGFEDGSHTSASCFSQILGAISYLGFLSLFQPGTDLILSYHIV